MGLRISACVAAGVVACAAGSARAELLYGTGVVSGVPVISRFDSGSLGVLVNAPVVGLQTGETLVGIDVRPQSPGTIYGIGSTSRVYTVNPITGVATQVGTGTFSPGLNGTAFGTDFNPVPDRIRQVSNTEQNLRLDPFGGFVTATDTPLTPVGNIVAAAYTNNFPGATQTTLYAIDSAAGSLVRIGGVNGSPSPNLGAVTTVGTTLGLGGGLNDAIGFDISGSSGVAYAAITTGGISRLYTVDLASGTATFQGQIGAGTTSFTGLTAANAPEPAGLAAVAASGLLLLRRRPRTA